MNYEDLIDQVVSDAMVATGDVLRAGGMHNGMRFRGVLKNRKPVGKRALRWTDAENQYYLEHANRVSLREIAVKLGRSTDAIKTHWGRYGMPAPTKFPEFLTANTIGGMLSLDPHKIVGWIDAGMIKGIRLGRVRRVSLIALKMWLVRPTSWVYFRAERIKNSALRSLVLRAQERWGDEWWDSRKVAEYHKCDTRDVCRLCANGQLPGYQAVNVSGRHNDSGWALWYIKKSDALKMVLKRGRGSSSGQVWSKRADAFLLAARDEGKTWAEIARMMKWKHQRCAYRWSVLQAKSGGANAGNQV